MGASTCNLSCNVASAFFIRHPFLDFSEIFAFVAGTIHNFREVRTFLQGLNIGVCIGSPIMREDCTDILGTIARTRREI